MLLTANALNQLNLELNLINTAESGVRLFTPCGSCFPSLMISVVKHAEVGDKMLNVDDINFFIAGEVKEIIGRLTIDFIEGRFKFGLGKKIKHESLRRIVNV